MLDLRSESICVYLRSPAAGGEAGGSAAQVSDINFTSSLGCRLHFPPPRPTRAAFRLAAQTQDGFAFHHIGGRSYSAAAVARSAASPLRAPAPPNLRCFHVARRWARCEGHMTDAPPSPPPAVNSLLLDSDNYLLSVALRCNATPTWSYHNHFIPTAEGVGVCGLLYELLPRNSSMKSALAACAQCVVRSHF